MLSALGIRSRLKSGVEQGLGRRKANIAMYFMVAILH